ncbi:hypothetical protein G9A89_019607 [Geosiphon pyriformis]|nr:hypothetical protein G9A89_019607 [Geosiphon pyriformis]
MESESLDTEITQETSLEVKEVSTQCSYKLELESVIPKGESADLYSEELQRQRRDSRSNNFVKSANLYSEELECEKQQSESKNDDFVESADLYPEELGDQRQHESKDNDFERSEKVSKNSERQDFSSEDHFLESSSNGIKKLTIPKPFTLQTALRAQRSHFSDTTMSPKSPFVPLVKQVQNYIEQTPERFKPKPIENVDDSWSSNMSFAKRTATIPKSPFLLTKLRAKPLMLLSTEEQRAQEAEKHEFKAKPVNHRIFELAGELGVSKVEKSVLTIPCSPNITKPKPPPQVPPSTPHVIKANPVPDLQNPFRPIFQHRKLDAPEFFLPGDEIRRRNAQEREERIKREMEEINSARQFRAQPLPSDSPDQLPIPLHYPVTHPKPFTFQTNIRGEEYQKKFQEKLNEAEQREKENKIFHARPLPKLEPVIPLKPEVPPPTEPHEFIFRTDLRIEEHKKLLAERKSREKEHEMLKEAIQKEEETRKEAEIRHLRSELVHHPEPIKHYTPVRIEPSRKRPTKAKSPLLGAKRRRYLETIEEINHSQISILLDSQIIKDDDQEKFVFEKVEPKSEDLDML